MIYHAYIESHLTYVLPVWGTAPNLYLNIIKVLQNKCMKIILKKSPLTSSSQLYNEKQLSLSQKIIFESIFYIFKIKNSLLKTDTILITYHDTSNIETRNSSKLKPPRFKGALAQRSIYYKGIELYNALPYELSTTQKISNFKNKLKTYVRSQFPTL